MNMTEKQGQYLSYIYYYSKINKCPPAEKDMQFYFSVTPPTVHQMILTLEKKGFISRIPGVGRSIKILISKSEIPELL